MLNAFNSPVHAGSLRRLAAADTLIRVSAAQAGRPAPPHGAARARARTRCRSGSWTDMTATGSDSMRTSLRARPAAFAADSRLPRPLPQRAALAHPARTPCNRRPLRAASVCPLLQAPGFCSSS